jgi:hypothetical protein
VVACDCFFLDRLMEKKVSEGKAFGKSEIAI